MFELEHRHQFLPVAANCSVIPVMLNVECSTVIFNVLYALHVFDVVPNPVPPFLIGRRRGGVPPAVRAASVRRQSISWLGSSLRNRLGGLCCGEPQADLAMAREM